MKSHSSVDQCAHAHTFSNNHTFLVANSGRTSNWTKLLCGLFLVLCTAFISNAATLVVTKTADTNDGVCDADCSLREAISRANTMSTHDIIEFSATFNSPQVITITGTGFSINNNGNLAIDGPGQDLLTISGSSQVRLFTVNAGSPNAGANLTLEGVTLANGYCDCAGGAVWSGQTLTLRDSTIKNSRGFPAVIENVGTMVLTGTSINHNTGIAVSNEDGSLTITNSSISNNTSSAVINDRGTISIIDSAVFGNTTTNGGGGLRNIEGTVHLNNSSVSNNAVNGFNSDGGGILNFSASSSTYPAILTITDSTIGENTSSGEGSEGGGIMNIGGIVTISGSAVTGNKALTGGGGGLYNGSGTLSITNSTFFGNAAAGDGGGVYNRDRAAFINATVAGNTADSDNNGSGKGGGVYSVFGNTLTSLNTIFGDNINNAAPDFSGVLSSNGFNLIEDTTGLTVSGITTGNILGQDPQFALLPSSAGSNQTLALMPNSPAIDTADTLNFPTNDQRGVTRPQDGDLNGSGLPDIGAYERRVTSLTVTKTTDTSDGVCDSDCSLREAVAISNTAINPDNAIFFSSSLFATQQSLTLTGGHLAIDNPGTLLIAGTGPALLTISGNNQSRIFFNASGASTVIRDLTIENGKEALSDGGSVFNRIARLSLIGVSIRSSSAVNGGGIKNEGGILSLTNSIVSGNIASQNGGGIDSDNGFPGSGVLIISGSTLLNNSATILGGGLYSSMGIVRIGQTLFENNAAPSSGGAIYSLRGTINVDNSTFLRNSSNNFGGAIRAMGGDVKLSIASSNFHQNSSAYGGGVSVDAGTTGTFLVANSIIGFNTATGRGGGILTAGGMATITATTFQGNSALDDGGGLANFSSLTLSNSTLTENRASDMGGAVYNGGSANVSYTTISDNLAAFGGGGGDGGGTFRARSSLIADNNATNSKPDFAGSFISQGFNLIENISGAVITGITTGNIIGQDPRLGSLSNYGGPTPTRPLLGGSPAIDAGDASSFPPLDQRGFTRPTDGDGDGNLFLRPDVGAFEVRSIAVTNTNDSGPGSLRQTVADALPTADSVVFGPAQFNLPQTITLTSGELAVPQNANFTVIGPGADKLTISGNGQSRVLFIGADALAAIIGVTITGGNGSGAYNPGLGGGVYNTSGRLTVLNSVVAGNAANYGGGIYSGVNNGGGTVASINSTIRNNSAVNDGGGVYVIGDGGEFANSQVVENSGGGVYSRQADLTFTNCDISNNIRSGIHNELSGTTHLKKTSVSNNRGGGGIFNSGELFVEDSLISSNTNVGPGGGIHNSFDSSATVTNSTISRNSSNIHGGGIFNSASPQNFISLKYATIVYNSTLGIGGGIFNSIDSTVNAQNSIIANNQATIHAPDFERILNSQGYNIVGNTTGTTIVGLTEGNMLNADPVLDPILRYNGALTKTHALRSTSPAVDRGAPANPALTLDQRGLSRPFDFATISNASGGDGSDIGSYERRHTDVTVGSRLDFDSDNRADLSVYRPSDRTWYVLRGTAGYTVMQFGEPGDRMVPGDYDGDAKTDIAMFRPLTGQWFIFNSGSQAFVTFNWGASGDMPAPADHDGDGKDDLVVFRPSNGTWYKRLSNNTFSNVGFGVAGDKPFVGDFDGDGKFDIGVYRPSNNSWYILKTGVGYFVQTWGEPGDIPVPADYDGDGKTDVSVWRPSTGQWFRIQSTAGFEVVNWGEPGDMPIPADYDGDGRADVAVFRPSTGTWYIVGSTNGQMVQQFGQNGDLPTQSALIY